MTKKIELISDENKQRVDIFIASKINDISRSEIKKYIKEGLLTVNGKPILKPGYELKFDDSIILIIPDKKTDIILPEKIKIDIIYEDSNLIVVNKREGMVVHPGAGNYSGTLVNALLSIRPEIASVGGEKRPGIVHRLDKDTSGVIVIAKDNETYLELQKQFSERIIQKKYILIVKGIFNNKIGKIDFPIGRSFKNRKKISGKTHKGRNALTYYKVLYEKKGFSLIEAMPKTGRTHQIRVHFFETRKPIIGDQLYGSSSKKYFPRLALHAKELKLFHPTKKHIYCFKTMIPLEFLDFFKNL
jgi:23S rRNA pseudouridine1911/1915/1917 synthase